MGCSWPTAKKYIEEHATVKEAYEAEKERVLDKAEANIIGPIMEQHDVEISKWYLTLKGGDRGYARTQRAEVIGGRPIEIMVTRRMKKD